MPRKAMPSHTDVMKSRIEVRLLLMDTTRSSTIAIPSPTIVLLMSRKAIPSLTIVIFSYTKVSQPQTLPVQATPRAITHNEKSHLTSCSFATSIQKTASSLPHKFVINCLPIPIEKSHTNLFIPLENRLSLHYVESRQSSPVTEHGSVHIEPAAPAEPDGCGH